MSLFDSSDDASNLKSKHSCTLLRLENESDLPPAQEFANAFERCTTPGQTASSPDLDTLQKVLIHLTLLAEYSSFLFRATGAAPDSHEVVTAWEEAKIKGEQPGGSVKGPSTTFARDVLPWYENCLSVVERSDPTSLFDIYSMVNVAISGCQLITGMLIQAQSDKAILPLMRGADTTTLKIMGIAIPAPGAPSMAERHASSEVKVFVDDVVSYNGESFLVVDQVTSVRSGRVHVVVDIVDGKTRDSERRITEAEMVELFNQGAFVDFEMNLDEC